MVGFLEGNGGGPGLDGLVLGGGGPGLGGFVLDTGGGGGKSEWKLCFLWPENTEKLTQ